MTPPVPDRVLPGQESVWAYPRPAIAESTHRHLHIAHRGVVIADTRRAIRTLETSHPPSYYFPPDDIMMAHVVEVPGSSFCEWKGHARYFDVIVGDERIDRVGWSYPAPTHDFLALLDHIAFYAAPFDDVTVDGERVTPQPGGFYGGWITRDLAGPFKGVPGSRYW